MSAMVCDVTKENCMHSICKDCPGKDGARSLLDEKDLEGYPERVEYKQWVASKKSAGERCRLINANSEKDAFYDEFVDLVYDLKVHHFTAQSQSSFLKEKKENLQKYECIILGDFAENYSFTIQDEVQSYHWNVPQATLHPFVDYCVANLNLNLNSNSGAS